MLHIETNCGNFGNFKDMYLFMQEEKLTQIEVTRIEYCLDEIFGKGVYTLDEVKSIIDEVNSL